MISQELEKLELGPDDARRVYWLKPPVLHERMSWRRAAAAKGARMYGQLRLLDLLEQGIRAHEQGYTPEDVGKAITLIAAHRQNMTNMFEFIRNHPDVLQDDPEFAALADLCRVGAMALLPIEHHVRDVYEPYALACADDGAYWQILGMEAARSFCTAWEGLPIALKRSAGRLSDECLAVIPEEDFSELGRFADRLARVSDKERKNSNSPPSTSSGGETSTSSNGAMNGPSPSSESSASAGPSLN